MTPRKHLIAGIMLLALFSSGASRSGEGQNWTHFVRIAGYGLQPDRVGEIVRDATDTHVFGIETDNDITGRYESFLDPAEKLRAIRMIADKAHAAGNYAFVYVAGLECITAHADKAAHTLFKDHPDWVQRKLSGEAAVFGGGSAFWIAPGDEDVWISPYAPEWREIYMQRIRQIAATGIDGIYVDIPYWMTHFEGWEDTWASFDDYTVAAFKARTGLDAKADVKLGDFSDPGFLRWLDFRIQTLTEFMKEIDVNAKAANPQCKTIAEIYPGIEEAAVRVGADVYEMYGVVDAIAHEYEYGSGKHTAASKAPLDWLHYLIGMSSFRSFAQGKASWMLSYSWDGEKNVDPREAMKNLFMAELTAGTNPWDARGHVMSRSNDIETRKAIFQWIAEHEKTFYSPRLPIHPVGVYFSPQTRNYFPREFVESFLGIMALLIQSHHEFQVVTPRNLGDFQGELLILPDVRCLSEDELNYLRVFIRSGKKLVLTGETGRFGERRQGLPGNPLHALLEIRQPGRGSLGTGRERYIYFPDCPGRNYLRQLDKEFNSAAAKGSAGGADFERLRDEFDRAVVKGPGFRESVQVAASPFVFTQIASVDGKIHVFLANFKGLKSGVNSQQIPETDIRISFPKGAGSRVLVLPYLGEVKEVKTERRDGRLTVLISELTKGLVVWCE